mgnify:CR=1 FL=1
MTQFNDFLNLISEAKKEIEAETEKSNQIFSDKIKHNSFFDLLEVKTPEPVEILAEEITQETLPEQISVVNPLLEAATYDKLFKTNVNLFDQPDLPKVKPELKALTDKVKYMEDWLTKISMAGPGGGEVNLRWLDDIDRSTIANDRYLKYDQHSNKFVFSNPNASELGTLDYIQLTLKLWLRIIDLILVNKILRYMVIHTLDTHYQIFQVTSHRNKFCTHRSL